MPNLLSYSDVISSGTRARSVTDEALNGLVTLFPQAVDCLLKLPYWVGDYGSGEPSVYRTWAHGAYVAAGHTFVALHQLLRSAFYLEALVLQRHLSEVLVQLIYFAERDQEAEAHFLPPPAKGAEPTDRRTIARPRPKRVRFDKMFDAVAPGYYGHWYYLGSSFAHGGIAGTALRHDYEKQTVTLGCQYDARHATLVGNQAVTMLYGFLRRFPLVFPRWKIEEAGPTREAALGTVEKILTAHWNEVEVSREWLRCVGPLIGWEVPEDCPPARP